MISKLSPGGLKHCITLHNQCKLKYKYEGDGGQEEHQENEKN